MSRTPKTPVPSSAKAPAKARKGAVQSVEAAAQSIERALDPLTSVIKRATQKRVAEPAAGPTKPVKGALPVSPLAVDFPVIPPIAGVELATTRAGFYKHEREDVLLMRFAEGTNAAGVFTRHGVGSAPVDWCRRQLGATGGAPTVLADGDWWTGTLRTTSPVRAFSKSLTMRDHSRDTKCTLFEMSPHDRKGPSSVTIGNRCCSIIRITQTHLDHLDHPTTVFSCYAQSPARVYTNGEIRR